MRDFDVIIVGAGHNGLATGALLAGRGLRVLALEKNRYVGGMAGTREILSGCRNDVGASLLFPLARGLAQELELERYGVELLDLPIMSCSVAEPGDPPLVFYANPLRMALGIWRQFGTKALLGFARLVAFTRYPAKVIARYEACTKPRDIEELIAEAPNARAREQLELTFRGSAMDLIDRFFPDEERHRPLRAQLAFAAVQSTYKGPYTPGSAFCLVYTLSPNDAGGLMKRVRGGMGSLSEALQRSIEDKGGEVRLGASVSRILVEQRRAVGVELNMRNGGSGAYGVIDKEGNHYTFFDSTRLVKSSDDNAIDALLRPVAHVDILEGLPEDVAQGIDRILGISMTYDGHLVVAAMGALFVFDRDLKRKDYLLFPGEHVENSIAIDEQRIYVVTSKFMRGVVWDGERLSTDEAKGAWKSAYDVMPEWAAIRRGAASHGSGTTPTLMGFGEDTDKLVLISDGHPDGANRAQQLAWLWQELPAPVIAAVQGVAYGGGLHIALGADIGFVAPDARLAFVEITWGLVPDLSGTQALRRLVPLAGG
jgi:hypothetical protein